VPDYDNLTAARSVVMVMMVVVVVVPLRTLPTGFGDHTPVL
jgi:hypothetical protein